jgi:hypothetical protein
VNFWNFNSVKSEGVGMRVRFLARKTRYDLLLSGPEFHLEIPTPSGSKDFFSE